MVEPKPTERANIQTRDRRLERIRLICDEGIDLCGPIISDYRFLLGKIAELEGERSARQTADERLDKLLDWLTRD